MIKAPFILGAQHISIEEWQADLKKIAKEYEIFLCTGKYPNKEQVRRLINFEFFIDALPSILKNA